MQRPKLLIILSRFPYPLEKGDKLRAYNQIKILAQYFDICLVCLSDYPVSDEHLQMVHPFVAQLHVIRYNKHKMVWQGAIKAMFTKLPLQVALFSYDKLKCIIQKIANDWQAPVAYLQLGRIAELAPNNCKLVLDFQDAFSANYQRTANHTNWYLRSLYMLEAKRMAKYEKQILEKFDATTIVSDADKQIIDDTRITVVPNGVDTEFFTPDTQRTKNYDIVFVGNLSYLPNILAVQYLVEKVLPLLPQTFTVLIAGAQPSSAILGLASNQVQIKPELEDIREAYASAKIFVAPLFTGAGVQNKILEAMCMHLPCITTPQVALGINAIKNIHLFTADTADEFASLIISVHASDNEKLTTEAYEFVHKHFSWQANTSSLVQLILSYY